MKLQLPTISLPKFINKTVLLFVAGALIVGAIIAVGIVQEVRADRQAAVETARQEEQAKAAVQANTKLIESLQAENALLKVRANERLAACDALVRYSQAATTRRLVTVPPYCKL